MTGTNCSKILRVPPVSDSTVEKQANAMFEQLKTWNLTGKWTGTTASNTGVMELVISYDSLFEKCSGPNVKLFDRFQKQFEFTNRNNYESAMKDKKITDHSLPKDRTKIFEFINKQLNVHHPREDYKELLRLCLLFLRGNTDKK